MKRTVGKIFGGLFLLAGITGGFVFRDYLGAGGPICLLVELAVVGGSILMIFSSRKFFERIEKQVEKAGLPSEDAHYDCWEDYSPWSEE